MIKRTEKNQNLPSIITLASLILGAAFSRLIPHPWNFTAIGAMALFGGASLQSRTISLAVPLAALFLSDLVLGFHSTMFFVYLPVALTVMMGWSLKENKKAHHLVASSLLTSILFFMISNFGVWVVGGFYAPTTEGLLECYVSAIPFFSNQIAGDLFFTVALFGSYELLKKFAPEFFGLTSKAI